MLKYIIYRIYNGYDSENNQHTAFYDLEDSDLGKFEIVGGIEDAAEVSEVIKFYSKMNSTQVAYNLTVLFGKYYSLNGWRSIVDYYNYGKKYVPELEPYQAEIEKLLLLQ